MERPTTCMEHPNFPLSVNATSMYEYEVPGYKGILIWTNVNEYDVASLLWCRPSPLPTTLSSPIRIPGTIGQYNGRPVNNETTPPGYKSIINIIIDNNEVLNSKVD